MRGTTRPDEDYFDRPDAPAVDDSFWDDDSESPDDDQHDDLLINSDPYAEHADDEYIDADPGSDFLDQRARPAEPEPGGASPTGTHYPAIYAVPTDEMAPLELDGGEFDTPPLDRVLEEARTVPHSSFHNSDNYLSAPRRSRPAPTRRNIVAVGAIALMVVLLAIVVGPKMFGGSENDRHNSVSANEPTTAPTTPITGSGPGDDKTGPAVILAYDYAYYVKRDGAAAASHFTDTEVSADPGALQKSIDAVPEGTTHSLSIAATTDPMVYNVILTLRTPRDGSFTYPQQYTVAKQNEKYLIVKKIECQGTCPLA